MKVALSGYYGFGNAGDEALLEGLIHGLVEAGHQPLVLSGDPPATREFHRVAARHRLVGMPAALLECAALVSGGGGLLQDRTGARSLDYYLGVIRAALGTGKRVVVYGQSIGPLTAQGKKKVAKALAGVPVAVRDRSSQHLLAEVGIDSHLVADPALLLAPPTPPARSHRPVLLVPRAGHPELTNALTDLARDLLDFGCQVEALALHPSEDEREIQRLAEALPGLPCRRSGDHREVLQLLAGSGLVVSARLHGLILAAVSGTPAIGLVYDPKVAGFLEESGGVGFSAPVDRAALLAAAREARPIDATKRRELEQRAVSGISWLDRALRGEQLA